MENISQWGTEPEQWYRYNGKERDTLSGWCDFGARWGILEIGRWNGVDPLANKYHGWSPFSFTLNNPISLIDPDGRGVNDVVYFNSKGQEVNRIVTTERYETYVDLNDDGNYSLAPMPNIISGRIDAKYQRYDYLIAAHTAIFNNTTAENRPTTANYGLSLDGDQPGALSPTLVKAVIMQETIYGTLDGGYNKRGTSDIMQANVQSKNGDKITGDDWADFKANFGLVQGGSATPEQSIFAGIRILYTKGLIINPVVYDEKGAVSSDSNVSWQGGDLNNWWYAVKNYRGEDWYAIAVFKYWHNSFFSKDSKYYK